MKRRTFLSRTTLGLSALAVGARGLLKADDGRRRIYGIPDSIAPRPPLEDDLLRLSLSRTDLPVETWRDLAALSGLAQDVFDNPEVAQAFTRDPRRYLQAVGMPDVRLDPQAIETRVALAVGDPELRAAIERDDPGAFLRGLESRGLLASAEPSQIADRLRARLKDGGGLPAGDAGALDAVAPEACSVLAICIAAIWVWVVVIQDAIATVNAVALVNIYAYALIYTGTAGPKKRRSIGGLDSETPLQMAGLLGGERFAERVADRFVEETVETIALAVESIDTYRDSGGADPARLRAMLAAQMRRQIAGHGAIQQLVRP
jgi:hypothetical protein